MSRDNDLERSSNQTVAGLKPVTSSDSIASINLRSNQTVAGLKQGHTHTAFIVFGGSNQTVAGLKQWRLFRFRFRCFVQIRPLRD